jgi:hypothetical protein
MQSLATHPIDELLRLEAGQRLDAAIEHLIFGRHVVEYGEGRCATNVAGGRPVPPRPFSSDLEATRLLVGQLEGGFIPVGGGAVDVVIERARYRAVAPTVPLAVCRAVLLWRRKSHDS